MGFLDIGQKGGKIGHSHYIRATCHLEREAMGTKLNPNATCVHESYVLQVQQAGPLVVSCVPRWG